MNIPKVGGTGNLSFVVDVPSLTLPRAIGRRSVHWPGLHHARSSRPYEKRKDLSTGRPAAAAAPLWTVDPLPPWTNWTYKNGGRSRGSAM